MNQGVFDFNQEETLFNNGEILYLPNFFSNHYFNSLKKDLKWQSDEIQMYGKVHLIPRLHCWYADRCILYEYSNIKINYNFWTKELLEIKELVELKTKETFNGMLGNLYRSGRDYVSWHSDDEASLGATPTIACASFGTARIFSLRNKLTKETIKLNLEDRSLLIMRPPTQRDWEHQINKLATLDSERISLTFRFVHQ